MRRQNLSSLNIHIPVEASAFLPVITPDNCPSAVAIWRNRPSEMALLNQRRDIGQPRAVYLISMSQ